MENLLDNVLSNRNEIQMKYDAQLLHNKEIKTQFQYAMRETEKLKDQIRYKTIRDEVNKENGRTIEKTLQDLKEQNDKLKKTNIQLEIKLKTAIQMNHRVTKRLEEERKEKDSFIKSKEEYEKIENMKMLALEEMNAQLKEKIQFHTYYTKKEFAARFNFDLSDKDEAKSDHLEINTLDQYHQISTPKLDLSLMTGNPCADIKTQIVSNYKLIKQLEEEILSLNKLRVKIKAAEKSDVKKPDG